MTSLSLSTLTPQLYIAACLLVAALDMYVALKVWDVYFGENKEMYTAEELEAIYNDTHNEEEL
jgi:hypothetical protein